MVQVLVLEQVLVLVLMLVLVAHVRRLRVVAAAANH